MASYSTPVCSANKSQRTASSADCRSSQYSDFTVDSRRYGAFFPRSLVAVSDRDSDSESGSHPSSDLSTESRSAMIYARSGGDTSHATQKQKTEQLYHHGRCTVQPFTPTQAASIASSAGNSSYSARTPSVGEECIPDTYLEGTHTGPVLSVDSTVQLELFEARHRATQMMRSLTLSTDEPVACFYPGCKDVLRDLRAFEHHLHIHMIEERVAKTDCLNLRRCRRRESVRRLSNSATSNFFWALPGSCGHENHMG